MEEQQPLEVNDGKVQQWIQDNLRIIVSIVAVLVIAGGIYSYSKRVETPLNSENEKQIAEESDNQGMISEEVAKPKEQPAPIVSQETENSFIETAVKGEGATHLARRALANYLEKNPDSSLTPEHKIYVEDYLRKKAGKTGIKVGTSVEFSKDMITEAIAKSKTLNDRQLQNLHKYSVRVPSLA
jgi:hypothetical protein